MLSAPNVVSLSRIALAVAFAAADARATQVALILAASATDMLDGWLARRQGIASRWGALIDPIADRFFVLTAVATYVVRGELTTTQYFLLLARDVMTAVGFLVARAVTWLRSVTFQARPLGKAVTVVQLATLLAVPLAPAIVQPLVLVVAALSVLAIADYTLALWRARAW